MIVPRWLNIVFMTFALAGVLVAVIIVAINVLGMP